MFCLNDSMRYFLCPGSTDMRKGMFSLSGLIREKMNGNVWNGGVYIFYVGYHITYSSQRTGKV